MVRTRLTRSITRIHRFCPATLSAPRCYSVQVIGREAQPVIRSAADLEAWTFHGEAADVELCGWVRSVRKSSKVRFVDVTDGSSMRPVQAVVDKGLAADIRPGAAVRLRGTWHNTGGGKEGKPSGEEGVSASNHPQPDSSPPFLSDTATTTTELEQDARTTRELQVRQVEILGASDPQTYPIQNKYQTPESLRNISHLRCRTPLNSTLLRLRSDVVAALTRFFSEQDFQQTHPPIITSSDCEGAGEAFTVKAAGSKGHFFKDAKYLTVSSQLHLEALAQSLGNVWALSPTFRAEQSDTSRHLSEFYMLEAEMSFVEDMDRVMDLIQRMLMDLARSLGSSRAARELRNNRSDSRDPAERLSFADLVAAEELQRRWAGFLSASEWPRITYTEAIERLKPVADRFEHKAAWGNDLQTEHEKYLAKEVGYNKSKDAYMPIFITHFPREAKAFYMLRSASSPRQGETVDCFDLLVPDVGEIAGGSMREHRLPELVSNMQLRGMDTADKTNGSSPGMKWYLDLRRWGCPPHGGFGLGFDRLLSYLTGVSNVRDVVPFPRYFQRCDC